MKVVLETKKVSDLSGNEVALLDATLTELNGLVGWSYSPLTGELALDFGATDEEALTQKVNDALNKVAGDYPDAQVKAVLVWEMVKEWPR